jgi:hypothetical protein
MILCHYVDGNVNCEFMCLFECEMCWRARAGPGSFVGRAFRTGPARMDLCSVVLGQNSQPVGRHGPARLIGRAQTGSGWAGPGSNGLGHGPTRKCFFDNFGLMLLLVWILQTL